MTYLFFRKNLISLVIYATVLLIQVMLKNLEQVVTMVLNSFFDPHPRVRWAAINAIGQLSTDLGPDLQNQYHQRVLPALASAMDDFQNPRVQVSHWSLLYVFKLPILNLVYSILVRIYLLHVILIKADSLLR